MSGEKKDARRIIDMPIERRDDLIAQVWAFLSDRGYTITAPSPAPVNPCYRTRHREAHPPHVWRNGIEVRYDVLCPGYASGDLS